MGFIPAIGAGVSVISGIANISAKNAAAKAQREQIAQQSYQAAAQQMANDATLLAQQQLAQQNYNNGILARMAQFQQAEMGLVAQRQVAALNAQQQRYALESGMLQKGLEAGQQSQALQRQAAQIEIGTDSKLQQSLAEQGAVMEAGTTAANQVTQALTAEQRKQLSLQAAGQASTSSFETAQDRELMKRLSSALSVGLGIDRDVLAREMQGMNEADLALAAERLGLLDNAANAGMVGANLQMLQTATDAGLDAVGRNLQQQQGAVDISRDQNRMMGQMDLQNALNGYTAQDYSLGTQRSLGTTSNAQLQQQLSNAYGSVRGAGLMDWLNMGVSTYGAISPILNRPRVGATQPNFLTGANGFYDSGLTDAELGRVNMFPPTDTSGGFTGNTSLLRSLR